MLSVVIPTFRKPVLLRRTLEALAPQVRELSVACEIVVVDDGSNDETPAVIASLASQLPVRREAPPRNEGRARARNRGWRAARGEWVLFLDDDIVLRRGALAAHVAAQQTRPAAYLGDVVTAPEVIDSSLFEYLDTRGVAKTAAGAEVPSRYLLTQNVSVPRMSLDQIGGFDEEFGAYGFEDMEIAFRLEDECGLRFYHLGGAVGEHIHHHTLREYLDKKQMCGRETLPQLARLHPHRMAEMRLDVLRLPVPGSGNGLVATLLDLSFRAGVPGLVAWTVGWWPAGVGRSYRHRAYDYLVMAAYAAGLRRSQV